MWLAALQHGVRRRGNWICRGLDFSWWAVLNAAVMGSTERGVTPRGAQPASV